MVIRLLLLLLVCWQALGHGRPVQARQNSTANLSSTANATVYPTTTALVMFPNRLYIVVCQTIGANATHTLTSGHSGVSWTQIEKTNYNTVAAPASAISIWRGLHTGSSALSGTLTNTASVSSTGGHIYIVECWNVDTSSGAGGSSAIVQSKPANSDTGNPTTTITAPNASTRNMLIWAVGAPANTPAYAYAASTTTFPTTLFTDQGQNTPANGLDVFVTYRAQAGYTAPLVSGTSRNWGGLCVEIKATP
jgi:hypothetical protein